MSMHASTTEIYSKGSKRWCKWSWELDLILFREDFRVMAPPRNMHSFKFQKVFIYMHKLTNRLHDTKNGVLNYAVLGEYRSCMLESVNQ